MLFVLNLFGVTVCQLYLGPQPHEGEGMEYVSNTGAELGLPFGFAAPPIEHDEDDDA